MELPLSLRGRGNARAHSPLAYSFFTRIVAALIGALIAALACSAAAAQTASADVPAGPPISSAAIAHTATVGLRDALDAAWAFSVTSRSAGSRLAGLQAREAAASAWFPGPPSVVLSHRSDRASSNAGLREYEAEIAVPLWNRGLQAAARGELGAQREAIAGQQALAQLKLAGEVRDAAGALALARVEHEQALRKRDEAAVLARDVQRRVVAGESPRVDALQAQSAVRLAEAAVLQAGAGLVKAQAGWRALTGLAAEPLLDERVCETAQCQAPPDGGTHPSLLAAQGQARLAQARLALAEGDRRDPMEIGVGITGERPLAGAASDTSIRVALRIPFATDSRNAPRLALARAELDAAWAEVDAAARQVGGQVAAARPALDAARQSEALAQERAALAAQIHGLMANSWRLGNDGLPALLRAEGEKSDADLALARARIESRRAVSQLNQALGLLP